MEAAKKVMTPEQVAEYLQISKETVYRYIKEGRLVASKLGRSYRLLKKDVDLLMLTTSTREWAREALFDRVEKVAEKNRGVAYAEVERDVAEAIDKIRRKSS